MGMKLSAGALAGLLASLMLTANALAGGTVVVQLWDKGAEAEMAMNMGIGMGGDISNAAMGIRLDRGTMSQGDVTFEVTNVSTDTEHEMIVAPISGLSTPLPYDEGAARVDEDAARSLGEVEELQPGESGSVTIHLLPGIYILYCNIANHYAAGMWTVLAVTAM